MRRSLWMLAIALGLIAAWSIGRLQAQGDKATFADPNHATFTEMPNAGRAGVSSATLWGDPNVGAAGFSTPRQRFHAFQQQQHRQINRRHRRPPTSAVPGDIH